MEGVESAMAPLQAPAKPRRGAGAATLRGRLALALDAVSCCFLAVLWVCGASNVVRTVATRLSGENSHAVAVAVQLVTASLRAAVLLILPVMLLRSFVAQTAEVRQIGGVGSGSRRRPSPGNTGACTHPEGLVAGLLVTIVGKLMQVLAPTSESCQGRIGSMVTDTGCIVYFVTMCRLIFPELLTRLWATYTKLKYGTAGLH